MRLFISRLRAAARPTPTAPSRSARGHRILERYGMTETGMLTSNPYDGERRAGSVGLPLPGVELRIAEIETGAGLPRGEVGIVEVRGPNVFAGYWRKPEKTAAEFRADGFFITGDMGTIDRGRLRPARRAREGPDHLGRAQRLSEGGRGCCSTTAPTSPKPR